MKKASTILISLIAMLTIPMTVFAAEGESKPNVIIENGTEYVKAFFGVDSTILSQGSITIIVIVALIAIAAIIVLLARKKKK